MVIVVVVLFLLLPLLVFYIHTGSEVHLASY
jgi:hypothetical protein